ncbi:unnamed protein product [Trifolium pratense]|uniref:Uncharacterized protein n=1 Tax=Trifolium pratense TaxID=57577 RepID=A0ACB0JM22_TRIPR|nr:unnamed protein product [Trifolium pratense]
MIVDANATQDELIYTPTIVQFITKWFWSAHFDVPLFSDEHTVGFKAYTLSPCSLQQNIPTKYYSMGKYWWCLI